MGFSGQLRWLTFVLHLGLERERVPTSDAFAGASDSLFVALLVNAIFARAGLVTEAAYGEALAIHLETARLGALAGDSACRSAFLLGHGQLGLLLHAPVLLDRLLSEAARFS